MNFVSPPIALLLLLSTPLAAEQIYKHIDEQGRVTYSNKPIKGGQKLDLPPLSTVTLPKPPAAKTGAKAVPDADRALRKKQLQEAIANEQKALEDAKAKAKEGDVPEFTRSTKSVPGKDGKPTTLTEIRDNPGAYEEKMKKLNDTVSAHEKKLAELKTELNRLDDKP